MTIVVFLFPLLVLGHSEEHALLLALGYLDDGSDELIQEVGNLQQGGVEVVQKVDDKTLDMRTVVILIRHDHEMTISERVRGGVVMVVLQTQDLLDVLDLLVLHDLVVARLADIEQLTAKREDTEAITALDGTDAGHGHRLGGVSFGEDESALACVSPTRPVRVVELRNSSKTGTLSTIGLLHRLVLLELGESKDILHNARLGNLLDEVFGKLALGAEGRRFKGEGLLGLRVEGGVLDERVHEDPHVVLDLERLDLSGLVLLRNEGLAESQPGQSGSVLTACSRAAWQSCQRAYHL